MGVGVGVAVGVGVGVGVGLPLGDGDGDGLGEADGFGGATPALSVVNVVLKGGIVTLPPTSGIAKAN